MRACTASEAGDVNETQVKSFEGLTYEEWLPIITDELRDWMRWFPTADMLTKHSRKAILDTTLETLKKGRGQVLLNRRSMCLKLSISSSAPSLCISVVILFSKHSPYSNLSRCSNLVNTTCLLVSSISPAKNTSSSIA